MSSPIHPPVVAGADGSEQSLVAVRWAAEYAARHHAPLELVYGIGVPVAFVPLSGPPLDYDGMREHGETLLAAAAELAEKVAEPISSIKTTTAAVAADPIPALRDRSDAAQLLVVGSRGLGAFRRALLGSVSTALARHANCPVAIIPDHDSTEWSGPVVVGVDGSECSARAVAIAFEEASARNAGVVALHTWSEFNRYDARPNMQTEAEALLSENLAGYREKYPDVPVTRIVVQDRPARALLHASESAQLIVLGSHGRGGFAGMTLGSVSQAVLHTAECPLIIVRERTDNHARS